MSNVSSSNSQEAKVPKLRFPEFGGEWNEHTLGELGNFIKGAPLSKADISEEGAPFILYGELYTTYNEVIDFVLRKTNRQVSPEHISKIGDVIIPTSGETPEEIATASCVMQSGVILAGDLNIYRTSLVDGRLISYIIRHVVNRHISSVAQGKSVVHVKADELAKIYIRYPEKNEQLKILNFLALIQKRINHQKKFIDTLKLYKRGALSRLFPKNGSRVPEYRFSGFTGDWEQRKLGEVADRLVRKNQDLESELPLTISAQYGLIDQNEFFDKRVASKDVSGYYLLKRGEFAYNKSTSNDAPWGAIKRLDKYEMGVVSTLYIIFKLREGETIDSDFFATYYDTDLWHKDIRAISAEGARNHGLLNIAPSDFFGTTLKIPQDIEEQKKIGNFFSGLDRLITLHQKKVEQYINLKQSMLEKLFI